MGQFMGRYKNISIYLQIKIKAKIFKFLDYEPSTILDT